MDSIETHREFEQALLNYAEMCHAVALSLTKEPVAARHLAERTILSAWADCESLDLGSGLKMALLSKLRTNFLQDRQAAVAAAPQGADTEAAISRSRKPAFKFTRKLQTVTS